MSLSATQPETEQMTQPEAQLEEPATPAVVEPWGRLIMTAPNTSVFTFQGAGKFVIGRNDAKGAQIIIDDPRVR